MNQQKKKINKDKSNFEIMSEILQNQSTNELIELEQKQYEKDKSKKYS